MMRTQHHATPRQTRAQVRLSLDMTLLNMRDDALERATPESLQRSHSCVALDVIAAKLEAERASRRMTPEERFAAVLG